MAKLCFSCRALDDICESIKELQFYKSSIFKVSTEEKSCKIVENGAAFSQVFNCHNS